MRVGCSEWVERLKCIRTLTKLMPTCSTRIPRRYQEEEDPPLLERGVREADSLAGCEQLDCEMRRDSYTLPDDNIRVTELMQDFSEGPGNVVNVFRDVDTKLTSCITFQTCHMRRMTRLFLEVMCVDATHGTNINRYRLISFMLTDKFGSGAFAQHSLIDGGVVSIQDPLLGLLRHGR
ncbi:hypothetical protein, variant 1 [Phytophthora nicotianae P10297]|uniref:ZSWIM1/3 RNaseH-like domain-containing protein n=8 Tax=Phytophthora nicotianae TaxID=4792 RepID=V9ECC9_PHYNI|nr:hypothetical protein F443_17676 [Phytophthora nicotianae P1569]ETO64873.1 hypothetical protein F444_17716 [Phytophthora nicotianae P1976]ETP34081.1 hypothetical protein F442_17533 [Phytophthora nicotianae P10297]ETI36153.1 hypothetical protein, variant 1 [Phytophthora nicotianae P1569]ETO64874.1 hypothetical protein, variant 1 [Phytophthora nicotianae P1976]